MIIHRSTLVISAIRCWWQVRAIQFYSDILLRSEELASEVGLPLWGSSSQSETQELISSSGFSVLFIQQIEQEILISLDESL